MVSLYLLYIKVNQKKSLVNLFNLRQNCKTVNNICVSSWILLGSVPSNSQKECMGLCIGVSNDDGIALCRIASGHADMLLGGTWCRLIIEVVRQIQKWCAPLSGKREGKAVLKGYIADSIQFINIYYLKFIVFRFSWGKVGNVRASANKLQACFSNSCGIRPPERGHIARKGDRSQNTCRDKQQNEIKLEPSLLFLAVFFHIAIS